MIRSQSFALLLMSIFALCLIGCSHELSFSGETPLLQQMFPGISKELTRIIARVGLLAAVFFAVAGWEHLGILPKLKWLFANWAKIKKYMFLYGRRAHYNTADVPRYTTVFYDANGKGLIYNTQTKELVGEETISPLANKGYVIIAALCVVLIFVSRDGVLHWLAYPFLQIWNSIQIWGSISIQPWWTPLLILVKCIGYLLWALLSYVLIYALGLLSSLRSSAMVAERISQRLSKKTFGWLLNFGLVLAAVLAWITY